MVRVGLAGAGAFGAFVLEALAPLPEVTLAAVAARTPARRQAAVARWQQARAALGLPATPVAELGDALELAASPQVDVVLVAVPPHLQPAVARVAVAAGKAVFLEKPGALQPEDLAAVDALARERGVAAALNLVMRASPLMDRVRRWYQAGWLGAPERWHVENWAGAGMPPDHWFWDPAQGGGVLVEHGVHFFDEVAWVLGARPRRALCQEWDHPQRSGAPARALAVVEYEGELAGRPWHLVASFYHAFVRAPGDERQVRELAFARGFVRVFGWVPEYLEADLDLPEGARAALAEDPLLRVEPGPGGRVRVQAALPDRQEAYRAMVRAGFQRLLAAAAGQGEPLAPLAAGVLALATARGRVGVEPCGHSAA